MRGRRQITIGLLIALLIALPGCSKMWVRVGPDKDTQDPEWSYEGDSGPEAWHEAYPECAGRQQSPIDIQDAVERDLPPLQFTYVTIDGRVRDAGHAIRIESEGGSLQVGDSTYVLTQLHFHVPGEHAIEGETFDAVIHLVHMGADSQFVVVDIPVVAGDENDLIADVLTEIAKPVLEREELGLEDVLPENLTYYSYTGSLTTPPCTEGVRWFALATPVEWSAGQIAELAAYYEGNVRPRQPLNGREVLRSR